MNENEIKEEATPYEAPAVEEHGTIEEITEALGAGNKDGVLGSIVL